ncbi:hypothetical protein NBRC116602_26420 [Hyphomicrobiales bacterium 4NK60-0047b]
MVKKISAHINLASPGEHEYLASVSFEHARSVALRIQEIRLRPGRNEKPYKVPLSLLTWFTEHAAAGRELTREENGQATEAKLFTNQAVLREQIETFSLKNKFYLEVEITELDQNDESCARDDQGVMSIEVQLYYGPKAKCSLSLEPLIFESPKNGTNKHLSFPNHCGSEGRFDLVQATVKSNLGPLDPRSDKRLLLCTVKLSDTWQPIRNSIIERLHIYEGATEVPSEYIEDEHHYEELYKAFPHAQNKKFPKGSKAFGPLLPSAPKEKRGPWTISLKAPLNDPFWLEMAEIRAAHNNQPLRGIVELLIPEPGGNIQVECQFAIQFSGDDWLIIADGSAVSAPLLLPVNREKAFWQEDSLAGELTLSVPKIHCPSSQFLSIQYFGFGLSEGPVNIALTPSKKDAEFYNVKPEVTEMSNQQHQLILLNQIALNKKQKLQKSEFKLKCFWPDKQKTETFKINIKQVEKSYSQALSIDIGSKSIAVAAINLNSEADQIISLPLGKITEHHYLDEAFIPSKVSLSGRLDSAVAESQLDEQNWRTKQHPLSISFSKSGWQKSAIETRLTKLQRSYDLALPPKKISAGEKLNLKRVFSQVSNSEIPPSNGLHSGDSTEGVKTKSAPPLFLTATRMQNEENKTEDETTPLETEHFKTGLTSSLNASWLMSDVLDELYNFYGTYLNSQKRLLESDEKQKTAKLKKEVLLTLSHSSNLSETGKRRYRLAGASTLAKYEQGSFLGMGPMAELLGLTGPDQLKNNVALIDEVTASSYHALKEMAERDQPARAKKIQQIHIDIGTSHAALCAQSGWVGENNALVEIVHGQIELPLGARTLELALTKEIAQILETALGAGAQVLKQVDLPSSIEDAISAEKEETETAFGHNQFLKNLRQALYQSGNVKDQAGNDLHIVIGCSDEQTSLPLTLGASIDPQGEPISLWHGLRGEQLVCLSSEDGREGTKEWHIELRLEVDALAQRVGPLSTYLAFVAELLPRSIEQVLPKAGQRVERLFSVSGGASLFAPFRKLVETTAKNLEFRLLPLPEDYREAKSAISLGALEVFHHQNKVPMIKQSPNVILVPLSNESEEENDMISVAENGKLIVIETASTEGLLQKNISSVQLIETLPGFGSLLNEDPKAVYCQTYLDDLDRATADQWSVAAAEWQAYLDLCYQTLLNMPVETPESSGSEETSEGQSWVYKTLKKEEAQLTIGEKTFWVSTGLTRSTF